MRDAAPLVPGLGRAGLPSSIIGFFHGAFQPHLDPPGSFVGNFATNYAQTQFNNLNLGSTRNYASALSMALPGSSLSTTISIAQAAIQLAQSVIASYKAPSR